MIGEDAFWPAASAGMYVTEFRRSAITESVGGLLARASSIRPSALSVNRQIWRFTRLVSAGHPPGSSEVSGWECRLTRRLIHRNAETRRWAVARSISRGDDHSFRIIAGFAIALFYLAVTAPFSYGAVRPPPRAFRHIKVALFGDSLSAQAGPFFAKAGYATGRALVRTLDQGGTAPCDWLNKMRGVAMEWHPEAVALEFVGDNFTPCMTGYAIGSDAWLAKYKADTEEAITIFEDAGARVFLVGAPAMFSPTLNASEILINDEYMEMAGASLDVTYVDAGAAVETPAGGFAWTLPCLADEPCQGPKFGYPAGVNVVRSPDGVHFCPNGKPAQRGRVKRCTVYMSGAVRFGEAMFAPIAQAFSLASK